MQTKNELTKRLNCKSAINAHEIFDAQKKLRI